MSHKSIKKMLKSNLWLVSLDKRSGLTFEHYKHRLDIYRLERAEEFINWARENLGNFMPWNMYLAARQGPMETFVAPNWVIRYSEPGSVFTEIFIHPDLVSFVMLHWMDK